MPWRLVVGDMAGSIFVFMIVLVLFLVKSYDYKMAKSPYNLIICPLIDPQVDNQQKNKKKNIYIAGVPNTIAGTVKD